MEIKLKDEFIKLGQALKAAGLVDSGVVAKIVIQDVYKRQPIFSPYTLMFNTLSLRLQ